MKRKSKRKTKTHITKRTVTKKTKNKHVPVVTNTPVEAPRKPRKTKKLTVSKIVCSKCKTEKKSNKTQMDKLIGLFGSIESVHDKYHCATCRKTHNVRKDGKPKPEKRTRKPKRVFDKLPSWMSASQSCYGSGSITKPDGITTKKWSKILHETVDWALKEGLLVRSPKQ